MTCPYCSQPMERGSISCDGRRRPFWRSSQGMKEIALAKFKFTSLLGSYNLEAFYCDSCKKIIIDMENAD